MSVVAAGADLMVDEAHFRVFLESHLFFMIANEDKGRIEPCNKFTDHPIDKVSSEIIEAGIVRQDKDDFDLHKYRSTIFFSLIADVIESNLHLRYRNSKR